MAAGDEISFGMRAPTDAIKADMAATLAVIDGALHDIEAKTAQVRVEVDKNSIARMRADIDDEVRKIQSASGGGAAGGGSADTLNAFIGFRATIRAIEGGVHSVEAGLAAWRVLTADTANEGAKILDNTEKFVRATREIPVIGNLLAGPIRGVEDAANAAKKALAEEEQFALRVLKHIQETTKERQKNDISARDQARLLEARAVSEDQEKAVAAQIKMEQTIRENEAKSKINLLSDTEKDRLNRAAAAERDRSIFAIGDRQQDRLKEAIAENLELHAELEGNKNEAERLKIEHSFDRRVRAANESGRFDEISDIELNRNLALQVLQKKQIEAQAKATAEFAEAQEKAFTEGIEAQQKDLKRNQEKQARFEEDRIEKGERTLAHIAEARAKQQFEAVFGSQSDLTGGPGAGVGIKDSVEIEKQILNELKLLTGKDPVVLKVF